MFFTAFRVSSNNITLDRTRRSNFYLWAIKKSITNLKIVKNYLIKYVHNKNIDIKVRNVV